MKLNSRLMGVLIVLWVVVCMAFPAFAQYTLTLEAKDGGGNVKTQFAKGDDLFLYINLNNAAGVAGCAFTLNFPANVLAPPSTNADGLPVNSGDIASAFPFTQNSTPTHRENAAEAGKIYFAGAEIDPTDGGAKYASGQITLFTVKFKVKTDAPAGAFSPTLTQTELFNPAAGYGTDANSNGVFDAGDTKGKVPVLVGAVAQGEPGFDNFNCSAGPCAFPVRLGDQTQALASLQFSVKQVVPQGDELAIDFGNVGIWHYNGSAWNKISEVGAQSMMNFNGSFLGDFGAQGVWQFDGTNWTWLSSADPDNNGNAMIAYGTGVVIDFGGLGLWYTDGTNWSKISNVGAEFMIVYNNNFLVGDFGTAGVWQFDGALWSFVSGANPNNTGNSLCGVNLQN
jgi:hypothetical protein